MASFILAAGCSGPGDVRDPGEEGPFTLGEPTDPEASVSVHSINLRSPEYLPGLELREINLAQAVFLGVSYSQGRGAHGQE